MAKEVKKVAFLTAGGLAPCLSSSIGFLIDEYNKKSPKAEMIGYINGYMGLLKGDSIPVTETVRKNALVLTQHGGSPIGNSRVKLTNVKDCVKRGLVKEGEDPLKVAADQLVKDGVDVLHTIGGDDTNTTAADLAAYLAKNNYPLIVVGLPKTIDNDVYPIKQSLGAWTAAEEGAKFFLNVVKENSANPRALTIHEVMGRNCGWLTYKTAQYYRKMLKQKIKFLPEFNLTLERQDVHAGGSGCGCSASVLCGHLLTEMKRGTYRRILFAATGALMSPTTSQQGESIPGICHAVSLDMDRGC